MFQSSSNLSVGCSTVFSSGWGSTIVKSFQFSPNLSAGCSHSMVAGMCAGSFNPQPNLSVGCSFYRSFNPHPTERLGAAILWSLGCGPAISILNPTDRLSAAESLNQRRRHSLGFNPHPTSRLGASVGHLLVRHLLGRFNPYPTKRLGAVPLPGFSICSLRISNLQEQLP